jgi:RNA polymerase sigma-70 factor (ECF subfamily)
MRLLDASDAELLESTRAGDAEAFGAFFRRYDRIVLGFVRRRVGSADLAADLTAETFTAALIATHRGHARNVPDGAAWLRGIARHKIVDSYRAGRLEDSAREQLGLQPITLNNEDLETIDRLGGADSPVHGALEQLTADERAAVLERVVLARGYDEIAARTHTSEAVARKRVSRGLARLRREMGAG